MRTTLRWDGAGYHRVATVQEAWGRRVLQRIPRGEFRRILDAGCGSGRLTAHLLREFPRAQVVGLDRSAEMLEQAERALRRFSRRLRLVQADLLTAQPGSDFDLVFSNATFHWVLNHERLFRNVYSWLAPGGLLVAQCGGQGNLRRIERLISRLANRREFRSRLSGFRRPVYYAGPSETKSRLDEAHFSDIEVWLHDEPTPFPSRAAFAEFIRHVICVPNLSRLNDPALEDLYLDEFLRLYERVFGSKYLLDYVRLNLQARKP